MATKNKKGDESGFTYIGRTRLYAYPGVNYRNVIRLSPIGKLRERIDGFASDLGWPKPTLEEPRMFGRHLNGVIEVCQGERNATDHRDFKAKVTLG